MSDPKEKIYITDQKVISPKGKKRSRSWEARELKDIYRYYRPNFLSNRRGDQREYKRKTGTKGT